MTDKNTGGGAEAGGGGAETAPAAAPATGTGGAAVGAGAGAAESGASARKGGVGPGAAGALIGAAVVAAVLGWFVLTTRPEAPQPGPETASSPAAATPSEGAGTAATSSAASSAEGTAAMGTAETGTAAMGAAETATAAADGIATAAGENPAAAAQPEATVAVPEAEAGASATSDASGTSDAAASVGDTAGAGDTTPGDNTAGDTTTADAVAPQAGAAAEAAAAAQPLIAPKFDTLRAGADGSVLVAGQADAGVAISVTVDGTEAAQAETNARGQFASLFSLPLSDQPRIVALAAKRGTEVRKSEETMIIAPRSAGEVAAAAAAAAEAPAGAAAPAAGDQTPGATGDTTASAAAAPSVLVSNADGVRVLAPGAAPALVIDAISYDSGTDVTVAGRGAGEAGQPGFVRAYLNNADMALGHVAADGSWSLALKDVAPGTYTLRIDAVSAGGRVTGRAETPFRRETPEVLAAAQPAAPAPGQVAAKVVTVQPGFTLWGIARDTYGDGFLYVRVFEANKGQIRNPDLIYPGQVFALPQ